MLDTISHIPTILAYAFITLLVVILCFIVIYVSHKIYISIYDNLPVKLNLSSLTFPDSAEEGAITTKSTQHSIIARYSHHISRKSKTVQR